jgi:mannose-1-phosphate guanylyltransferase/mannose-6-phosphate isomerase
MEMNLPIYPLYTPYIPLVQTHRLSNPGNEPVEIVEAVWALLGEDDIMRLHDNYGRKRDS